VAKSVNQCHLSEELEYIYHEAHVLGFGKIKSLDKAAQILLHGADVYDDLYQALRAIQSKDYRSAGANVGKVMQELSQWTKGHACTSPYCYVAIGMFEFLGDIKNDIRSCEGDFKMAFSNFSQAFRELHNDTASNNVSTPHDFLFAAQPGNTNSNIKRGIRDIGYGLLDVAKGTKDCHLEDFADILSKLAVKLGILPEIGFVEEVLHILIEGVHIENEIGAACLDYSEGNWVGFGYNVVRLIKTLLEDSQALEAFKARRDLTLYV
jgi:hypothetical protein